METLHSEPATVVQNEGVRLALLSQAHTLALTGAVTAHGMSNHTFDSAVWTAYLVDALDGRSSPTVDFLNRGNGGRIRFQFPLRQIEDSMHAAYFAPIRFLQSVSRKRIEPIICRPDEKLTEEEGDMLLRELLIGPEEAALATLGLLRYSVPGEQMKYALQHIIPKTSRQKTENRFWRYIELLNCFHLYVNEDETSSKPRKFIDASFTLAGAAWNESMIAFKAETIPTLIVKANGNSGQFQLLPEILTAFHAVKTESINFDRQEV